MFHICSRPPEGGMYRYAYWLVWHTVREQDLGDADKLVFQSWTDFDDMFFKSLKICIC